MNPDSKRRWNGGVGYASGRALYILSALFLLAGGGQASTLYVDANSANPTPPYGTWATAARVIQDAVDTSMAGDEIVVTNGVYATGGRAVYGTMTNRVAANRAITLRSVNGPQFTMIQGYQVPGTTNGDGAIRCVYLTNGAALYGFTLTNGATRGAGVSSLESSGGGLFCESLNSVVSNCVFCGNSAYYAGGAFQGTLNRCVLTNNSMTGQYGGYGGGAGYGTLNHCLLSGNAPGGSDSATLNNCLVVANLGIGATGGTLNNCTVVSNTVLGVYGWIAGSPPTGILCIVNNSIVYYNGANNDLNLNEFNPYYSFSSCCTMPLSWATDSITNEPSFVDLVGGDLRLQAGSPCINAGNNSYVATSTDLDGNPRIVNGTVDMGAYEFQGSSGLTGFHAWLAQYGLPTDGSADYVDSDGDGMNNWQEWICGTDPTNAASALRLVSAAPAGTNVTVTWQSVLGIDYFLQRSTNLFVPGSFFSLGTNLPGQAGTTSFTDTNAVGAGPLYYRVGVGN